MKFSNKTYDILKWVVGTVLPAVLTFYGVVGDTFGIPFTIQVLTVGAAFIFCLGTCLGISNINYKKGMK